MADEGLDNIFEGVENAQKAGSRNYIRPGVHLVRVVMCKGGRDRETGQAYYVVEVKVIRSRGGYDVDKKPVAPHMPGEFASWFVGIKKETPALGNIRAFVAAATTLPLDSIDQEDCLATIAKGGTLLSNTLMVATAIEILTTKKQQPFTLVEWEKASPELEKLAGEAEARGLAPQGGADDDIPF